MADTEMNYLYTIGGYAALFGIGYTLYHLSAQKANRRTISALNKASKNNLPEPRKEDRKKKQRLTSFTSDAKNRAKSGDEASSPRFDSGQADSSKSEDGVDNHEFARQFAKAQQGTDLASRVDPSKQREKSVKQSRASKIHNTTEYEPSTVHTPLPSDLSSAAGADPGAGTDADADTDDNSSVIQSPQLRAADTSGIGDMLEPTLAGPSTLRIIGDDRGQTQKPKVSKASEHVESKKQRQNRKKAEAAKAARQMAEKERKALEEKQRRTARISEGVAAKDGSRLMAAQSTPSVWIEGAPKDAADRKQGIYPSTSLHQPLETSGQLTNVKSLKPQSSWMSSLPSEEEQMEMLRDETDDWNTVTTKFSKRASKKTSSVSSSDEKINKEAEVSPQSQPPVQAPRGYASKMATGKQYRGSFSALTTNDDGEDVEEEWDV